MRQLSRRTASLRAQLRALLLEKYLGYIGLKHISYLVNKYTDNYIALKTDNYKQKIINRVISGYS